MSMEMSQKPISSLAKEVMDNDMHKHHNAAEECNNYGWWFFLFWFLVIGIIVWFVLFALKPDFVQEKDRHDNPTGEVDQGKVLGSAIVISLVLIFVVWLFAWAFGATY